MSVFDYNLFLHETLSLLKGRSVSSFFTIESLLASRVLGMYSMLHKYLLKERSLKKKGGRKEVNRVDIWEKDVSGRGH